MDWQPIETAPRDGTEVILTWMEDGKPAEQWPMVWNQFAENAFFQDGKGIWAMHDWNTGALVITWTEANGAGPTHWRPSPPLTERSEDE